MLKRYFVVLIGVVLIYSCAENNKPSTENNVTTKKDMVVMNELEEGRTLFLTNCASCHAVKSDLTGPALKGVEDRWKNKEKLYSFIKNSQQIIAEDAYAKDLYNRWNKVRMTPFSWIKDEQIDVILKYINSK